MSLAVANNYLAVHLHRSLAEEKKNVCFSPFSVSTAMAMLLCAAEGETRAEMMIALGYETAGMKRDEITSAFEQQMSLLLNDEVVCTFLSANSIVSRKDFKLKGGYKELLAESFKALLSEVDFRNDSDRAISNINDWVKRKTNNMIPNLLHSLHPEANVVLVNAVYFKGEWLTEFDEENTVRGVFYNRGSKDNRKQVDMMNIDEGYFPLYGDESILALQLPYEGEELAMLILLPHKKDGLESVEAGLLPTFIQDIKENIREAKVKVSIPKFRLEYSKELSAPLKKLGIDRVFGPEAELGVAFDSPDVSVSEIIHKCVLEVNEEGSEAAAVTAVIRAMSATPEFIVDHPFIFIIFDTRNDLILFMGRVDEL